MRKKQNKYSFTHEDIQKGVKAFKEFRKMNKKQPLFFSDTISNEQVACYVLWILACIKEHQRREK